jgi:hypothetical protein
MPAFNIHVSSFSSIFSRLIVLISSSRFLRCRGRRRYFQLSLSGQPADTLSAGFHELAFSWLFVFRHIALFSPYAFEAFR